MGLKRPIEKQNAENIEIAREKFIRGGGLVPADVKNIKSNEWTRLSLRIKVDAINYIDDVISNKMGVTRTGWILQAIEEKMERDNADS